jgi:menaquinone-dependent protoporphyrinogen IX oxidase
MDPVEEEVLEALRQEAYHPEVHQEVHQAAFRQAALPQAAFRQVALHQVALHQETPQVALVVDQVLYPAAWDRQLAAVHRGNLRALHCCLHHLAVLVVLVLVQHHPALVVDRVDGNPVAVSIDRHWPS